MKYYLSLAVLILFFSCSKKEPGNTQVDLCNSIVEVYQYHPYGGGPLYQLIVSITYDQQGRVKAVIGEGLNRSEYTYFDDRIELTAKDIFGNDISATYYLDNMKRVVRTNSYDYKFTYNSEGCLISYRSPYGNGQITGFIQYYVKWENGNISEIYTNDANVSDRKIAFQYYNEPNQNLLGYNSPLYISQAVGDRPSFFLIGSNFFGKQPKDLYKTLIKNDIYNGTITYQYDTKGRISSIKDYYQFNYKCQ